MLKYKTAASVYEDIAELHKNSNLVAVSGGKDFYGHMGVLWLPAAGPKMKLKTPDYSTTSCYAIYFRANSAKNFCLLRASRRDSLVVERARKY